MELSMGEKRSSQAAALLILVLLLLALGMPALFSRSAPVQTTYEGIPEAEVQAVLDDVARIPR